MTITRAQMRWDVPQRLPTEGQRVTIATYLLQGVADDGRPVTLQIELLHEEGLWHILQNGERMTEFAGYESPIDATYDAFGSFVDTIMPDTAKRLAQVLARRENVIKE